MQAMIEGLGERFTGSSNCLIAMRRDIEAIGTNAHELPMVYAALAEDDAALAAAPYRVLENWHARLRRQPADHPARHLRHQGLPRAGAGVARRPGPASASTSGVPEEGAETAIAWWESRGQDPREKLVIFSDGLDVDRIEALYARFHGRVKLGFGWGTLLTNDFRGLAPRRRAGAVQPGLQGGQRQRPADGQALRQPGEGDRPRRPRSRATSGCSGSARRWRSRCWCEAARSPGAGAGPAGALAARSSWRSPSRPSRGCATPGRPTRGRWRRPATWSTGCGWWRARAARWPDFAADEDEINGVLAAAQRLAHGLEGEARVGPDGAPGRALGRRAADAAGALAQSRRACSRPPRRASRSSRPGSGGCRCRRRWCSPRRGWGSTACSATGSAARRSPASGGSRWRRRG